MKEEFYWINTFNLVEFDGPFPSIRKAREGAIKSMMQVQGMALSIDIVKVINKGQVTKSAKWIER